METSVETSETARPVPRLALRGASKSFGQVRALIDGDLALMPGEVHALLGASPRLRMRVRSAWP